MRWFRDHVRHGSWLALVALAINLAVAFGHVHALDGSVSERGPTAITAAANGDRSQHHPADGQADYLCPICMAATAMAKGLASTPPALPLEFANVSIDRTIGPVLVLVEPPRAAFQSRGPPIS